MNHQVSSFSYKGFCSVLNFYKVSLFLEMPKYAVAKGREVGIFDTWDECKQHVQGFAGAKYKKFDTLKSAEDFIAEHNPSDCPKRMSTRKRKCNDTLSLENVTAIEEILPVPRVSPSNTSINDMNKKIKLLESRLSNFIKTISKSFTEVKNRLQVLEEKCLLNNQSLILQNKNNKILADSSQTSKSNGETSVLKEFDGDLDDEDFINLNYDEDENGEDADVKESSTSGGNSSLPEQKSTKLSKCKIIDEVDGYFSPGQCPVNDRGYLVNPFGAVIVYTDGACSNNGRAGAKAGIGVWFNHNHPRNFYGPVTGRATNNNAEIQAATAAILQASKDRIRNLHIYTDSQFLINCITSWIYKWKKNDWKTIQGKPVINKVELEELDYYINELMDCVSFTYVKGHSGDVGNTSADELARIGASMYLRTQQD